MCITFYRTGRCATSWRTRRCTLEDNYASATKTPWCIGLVGNSSPGLSQWPPAATLRLEYLTPVEHNLVLLQAPLWNNRFPEFRYRVRPDHVKTKGLQETSMTGLRVWIARSCHICCLADVLGNDCWLSLDQFTHRLRVPDDAHPALNQRRIDHLFKQLSQIYRGLLLNDPPTHGSPPMLLPWGISTPKGITSPGHLDQSIASLTGPDQSYTNEPPVVSSMLYTFLDGSPFTHENSGTSTWTLDIPSCACSHPGSKYCTLQVCRLLPKPPSHLVALTNSSMHYLPRALGLTQCTQTPRRTFALTTQLLHMPSSKLYTYVHHDARDAVERAAKASQA